MTRRMAETGFVLSLLRLSHLRAVAIASGE